MGSNFMRNNDEEWRKMQKSWEQQQHQKSRAEKSVRLRSTFWRKCGFRTEEEEDAMLSCYVLYLLPEGGWYFA